MITENLLTNRSFSWFDVKEPNEEDLHTLSTTYHLPNLLVQDTVRPEHLPKYEESEDNHFLMLRSYDPKSDTEATTVQELTRKIALFITHDQLISIHRVDLEYINKLTDRCKKNDIPKTLHGLVHQLILGIIRTYEKPVDDLQDLYEFFENEVLSKKRKRLDTARIYHFRRQIFVFKRILKQTNDALYRSKEFWDDHHSMLQDLKENIDQVYFQLDEISDNFEHLFELHIALNDQRANDVMKILTVFSTILLPLNFIASFYGMNFTQLPGLDSWEALVTLVFVMIIISILSIWYFKYKGWFNTSRE